MSESAAPSSAVASDELPRHVWWAVDVGFRRRAVASRWVEAVWELAVVRLPSEGIPEGCDAFFPAQPIEVHPSEGEGYWLNLHSPAPCVFVMWRHEAADAAPVPTVVTLSYNEAGRMLDAGEQVEQRPMPEPLRAALEAWVAAHYTPETRRKVRRNDPFRDASSRASASGSTAASAAGTAPPGDHG